MAPVEATLGLADSSEGISDSARARELYKYFRPDTSTDVADNCFPAITKAEREHIESQDDTSRDIPVKSDITSSKISSPDTALTAFCQLITWRLGAQRAMIGLIDADTQYFVAESTKTVDLVNATVHGPGDDLWMGCDSVAKAGKLCERTIQVQHSRLAGEEHKYPCFIVNDLEKDERFNQLPFVTGSPHLRFYAGVPLITPKGIAIGSLFIVDDHVRDGLPEESIHFMGTMAVTIMKHLEMTREVEERRRGMKMSRGLASFVEGRAELLEADAESEDGEGTRIAGRFETEAEIVRTTPKLSHRGSVGSAVGSVRSLERKQREYSADVIKSEEGILAGVTSGADPDPKPRRPELSSGVQEDSQSSVLTRTTTGAWSPLGDDKLTGETSESQLSEESAQRRLTSRAANLIRETFEVDGGCIFYDAQVGYANDQTQGRSSSDYLVPEETTTESAFTSGDDFVSPPETSMSTNSGRPPIIRTTLPTSAAPSPREGLFSRSSTIANKVVDILGFSTPNAASIHKDPVPGPESFRPMQEKALHSLLRRYPRGKLWTFDSEGGVSSSEDDQFSRDGMDPVPRKRASVKKKPRSAKTQQDAKFLSRHFPGVRQLLFVPLWDAGRTRWLSGCFVWSTEVTRVLSKQSELSFLTAFGNSVMAEWSRIDTEIANQKKGDFIGSISHELRSPLHGILASAEFLSDEVKSTFEMGMVETISSCGRTLLDTINHVLDFSKINNFERTWRKTRRGSKSSNSIKQSELPMINIYADIDVAVVCEEVVEGVYAGHIFQSSTAPNFDMVAQAGKARQDSSTSASASYPPQEVAVIFDVDLDDYKYTTQPGAFRRIVMNLLGNALKYTAHGFVRIKLSSTPMDDYHDTETGETIPRSMINLTVSDTGKGISPEFLRSKLFTPFAQENSLSSGTGLGLSIVKSIVHILEGDITIESEVGRGTQVRVSLPLLRGGIKHDSGSTDTPKSIASYTTESEESITKLRSLVVGQRVSLHGFETDLLDPTSQKMARLLEASVNNLLTNWYGMVVVPHGQKAAVVISNDGPVSSLSRMVRHSINSWQTNPVIIVLCSHLSHYDRAAAETDTKLHIGYVNKPVGPLKLGKAIAQGFEGLKPPTPGPVQFVTPPPSNDFSNSFEEMKLNATVGEMLDNSRMAADSANARKAIERPTPNAVSEKAVEFPFPAPSIESPPHPAESQNSIRPTDAVHELSSHVSTTADPDITHIQIAPPSPTLTHPSFLLVDDNVINLTLLGTSIGKRKNETIDKAMDGLAAVKKFQERPQGYDIIFMDISMPLLDGFGATEEIRAIEETRKLRLGEDKGGGGDGFVPALVIAITGLASSDDQAHAAKVGVDLFLTKPVSFKDVKKMLDNWEANREEDLKR